MSLFDLNKRIAELKGMRLIPNFANSIETAWPLLEEAKKSLFSERNRFLEILADLLQNNELLNKNEKIAWPNAIMFITPENICKAWIKWKETKEV